MNRRFALAAVVLSLATSVPAVAAPEPKDTSQQTPWKLYLDSKEAFAMKAAKGDQVLLVDVRDPVEIMFTGFAQTVDVNVPFKVANPTKWNPTKPVFMMETNTNFEAQIAEVLNNRGLPKSTPILLMCRSGGERGAPSANLLWGKGYDNVYVIVDGFEGSTIKTGERKNWRQVDGWKNSGLPWSYTLDPKKFPFAKPTSSN